MFKRFALLLFTVLFTGITLSAQEKSPSASNTYEEPQFANGKMTVEQFIRIYQNYPDSAIKAGIEGTVIVELTVTKSGSVKDPKVVQSVHALLDAEAMRIVSLFPDYKAAKHAGAKVATTLRIPFTFKSKEIALTESKLKGKKNPLYVVDGKPMSEDSSLSSDIIKEIRVLKGQAAIAKYGDRAVDGVVEITTTLKAAVKTK